MNGPKPLSHPRAKQNRCLATLFAPVFAVALLCASAFAAPVTGVVTNRTTHKPSAGDDVVLLQLAQGMQELARTKTDSRGRFSIEVPADGLHLLRVTHDKANYFKPIQPGTQSVDIDVYSASATVEGVSLDADVMRLETDPSGASLKVVEHFFLKNASSPPKTLMSDHPFELYLPAGATVEGLAAKGPGGMAVQQALVPESEPNKYTIIFPIRPGSEDTEFQVTYKIPYNASTGFAFQPRPTMPTDALVLMMPKSMTFRAGQGSSYSSIEEEPGAQTYAARNVQPSEPLSFTVSGSGQLPRDVGQGAQAGGDTSQPPTNGGTVDPNADTRPGGGLGVPVDKDAQRDPWTKYRWVILIALGIAFAGAAAFLMKGTPSTTAAAGPGTVLQLLRDEMFSLETEKLSGKITAAEYAAFKAAYDLVLKRAISRGGVPDPLPK
jgi:hypothetical protein